MRSEAGSRADQRLSAGAARPVAPPGWPDAPPPAPVPAPPPKPLEGVSRLDCLRLAVQNSRSLRIADSAMMRAGLGRDIALSQVYAPTLTASYTRTNTQDSASGNVGVTVPAYGFTIQPFVSFGYGQGAIVPTGADQYSTAVGVTVSRPLFAIAEHRRQRLPITTAEEAYYAAANSAVLERKKVELATTRAFFDVQRTAARARVRDRRVEDARDFLVTVKDNIEHGLKAPVEELFASINLNQAEADQLDERTNLQNGRETLLGLMALPPVTPISIAEEELVSEVPVPDVEADLGWQRLHHEDLGSRALEIDLEIEQLRVQRDQLAPQLTAALTAERRRIGDSLLSRNQGEDDNVVALTLTYLLPLDFNRGATARFKQIEREIGEKSLALRQAQDDLERQLRSAHRRIAQLGKTVELASQRRTAEQGKMAVTLARYQAGSIDNLEVTRSKQDLDNAEIALVEGRIALVMAAAEYRSLLPMPLRTIGAKP